MDPVSKYLALKAEERAASDHVRAADDRWRETHNELRDRKREQISADGFDPLRNERIRTHVDGGDELKRRIAARLGAVEEAAAREQAALAVLDRAKAHHTPLGRIVARCERLLIARGLLKSDALSMNVGAGAPNQAYPGNAAAEGA